MTREVYSDKKFIQFSSSQVFVRVFVDTDPEGERLARKYRIPGVPTLIVLDSKGQEIDRIVGGRSPADLIEELQYIFKSVKRGRFSI